MIFLYFILETLNAEPVGPTINLKDVVKEGYKTVLIPKGSFMMGCASEQEADCHDNEKPAHKVKISRSFYMMESEVTQSLYQIVMGENPSKFKGIDLPVERVSWLDAVKFANKLSHIEGLKPCYEFDGDDVQWKNKKCKGWRLPTEAEWERAARGPVLQEASATEKKEEHYKYAGSNEITAVAWYGFDEKRDPNRTVTAKKTKPVCTKQKNGYGLCDMSGNVAEWCWDRFEDSIYTEYKKQGIVKDPIGPEKGTNRVGRGGSWFRGAEYSRVSYRNDMAPKEETSQLGFRLVRIVK